MFRSAKTDSCCGETEIFIDHKFDKEIFMLQIILTSTFSACSMLEFHFNVLKTQLGK
jgi:hypothetical protein